MNSENLQTNNLEVSVNSETEMLNPPDAAIKSELPESQPGVELRLNQLKSEIDELQRNVRIYYEKSLRRDEIEEKLGGIKEEVDALQVVVMEAAALPWYKNASVIVAVLAVVFSSGTAIMSYLQVYEQHRRDARKELREVLQRLATLPKENAEILKNYENDPSNKAILSGFIAQENTVLIRQAMEIAERVPGAVTANEYQAIAVALMQMGLMDDAQELINKAIFIVKDYLTEVEMLRVQAGILFNQGDIEGGRQKFQQSMNLQDKYDLTKTKGSIRHLMYTNAFTLSVWARHEFGAGQCRESEMLLKQAQEIINKDPEIPIKQQVEQQLEYLSKNRQNCDN